MIKTGDVVRGLKIIWPGTTHEMVRAAREEGILKATQLNPFSDQGAYAFCPDSIEKFLDDKKIPADKKREVLRMLSH